MESGAGPQSPRPGSGGPGQPVGAPAAPEAPRPPDAGPQSPSGYPAAPGYGGPIPPGGWQSPPLAPQAFGYGGQLAGWGRRLGASLLDGLIITLPALLIMGMLGIGVVGAGASDSEVGVVALIGALIVTALIITIVSLVYAPLLMMRGGERNGQTLGKQVVGIRVVRTSGEPVDFLWAALREVAVKNFGVGITSSATFGIAFFVNYLWPLWDDQNRAVHDFIVSTRVVST